MKLLDADGKEVEVFWSLWSARQRKWTETQRHRQETALRMLAQGKTLRQIGEVILREDNTGPMSAERVRQFILMSLRYRFSLTEGYYIGGDTSWWRDVLRYLYLDVPFYEKAARKADLLFKKQNSTVLRAIESSQGRT